MPFGQITFMSSKLVYVKTVTFKSWICIQNLALRLELTCILQALVKLGARKLVLTNVGPLGCIPYRMTLQATEKGCCVKQDNELVAGFNAALTWLVQELNGQHPGAQFVVADSYNIVMQIIKHPSAFGASLLHT